ncbi:radical SAM protein [Microbacter sp. GSS18]|nr:radical SAM protein [Microbacter sp. GSS18]
MKTDTPQAAGQDLQRLRGADEVIGLLDGPAGAYLHVPFCSWICPFCPYNKVRADEDLASRYFRALEREVVALRDAHQARFGVPFTSVYVGGGTPTLYLDRLQDVLALVPTTGAVAIEVLPTHGTPRVFDRLAGMGVTAVSIGAQSFHDPVLRRLGRPHDAAAARSAVAAAVGRFDTVDVDLIVDVAFEGAESGTPAGSFLADVEACFDAGVDQVSTYPLMRFGYAPFGRAAHQRRREHAVLAEVGELAERMGYERASVWSFARSGAPPYTSITRRRFIGMGAGASSVLGEDFLVDHFGVATYSTAVEQGQVPVARRLHLGRWAGAAYDAFWQAYAGGVNLDRLGEDHGRVVRTAARTMLEPARWVGLMRREGASLRLTPRGFNAYHDLERAVTYALIEPLWGEMLREHLDEAADLTPDVPSDDDFWARTESARSGPVWRMSRRAFERPVGSVVPEPAAR